MRDSTACPRLRPTVDVARVQANGQTLVCLFDRQDPDARQVVLAEPALLLASLLDGERTASAVRAAFMVRTGLAITEQQVLTFIRQLDEANLLDSERYRLRLAEQMAAYRDAPARPAAHAGGAYPDNQAELRRFLAAKFEAPGGPGAPPGPPRAAPLRGLIAPHIDFHRGGHSYAWGYRDVAERHPADVYVILGTCHTPMSRPFALTAKPYDTPFGPAPTDQALVSRLASRAPFDVFADEYSHRSEHSIEFQAVFLRYLEHVGGSSKGTILPILCVPPGDLADGETPESAADVREFLGLLRETMETDGRRFCLIAGADFAHVGPQFGDPLPVDSSVSARVRRSDLEMLEFAARGDANGFYRQVVDEPAMGRSGEEARAVGGPRRICGLAPIYALLWLLGPSDGTILHYDQWIDRAGAGSVTFGCVAFP